jgi:tetratricopeptide (TPR) repeat protein
MLAGDNDGAVRAGQEVLPMAEALGLDDVRAALLNNIGVSRVALGDEGGLADLEQSLAIGFEHNLAPHLHRTHHNLMEAYRTLGRLEESADVLAAERRSDERFGLQRDLRWVIGEEASVEYWRGDWEAALARVDEFMIDVDAGSPHYMETWCRWVRAVIRLARGDTTGAEDDSVRTLDLAREQKDLQVLAPALAQHSFMVLALGRPAEASDHVDELLALPRLHYLSFTDLAWVLVGLGRGTEFVKRTEEAEPSPWLSAGLAIADGRLEAAADVLAAMGNMSDSAYARLRSGRDDQVRQAIEFYRSVGATRYIEEGEALLAATA